MTYSVDALRRRPDVEAPDLQASDAADRLILDESAVARAQVRDDGLVVIGDSYGALTLGAAADGARGIRVHQDGLTGERALAANADLFDLAGAFTSQPLDAALVDDARVVLLRLPRSLDALRDVAGLIAAHAAPDVVVVAGGRIKHMTVAMNDVLREHFTTLDVTHARQKSRALIARGPRNGRDPVPRCATHDGLIVCALGGAFAGPSIDIGTRLLLEHLPEHLPERLGGTAAEGEVIDFACGTGVVAATMALRNPTVSVYATDQSSASVASARATAAANGVGDRVHVARDDLLGARTDASASFIALNPPFHTGAAVTDALAPRFFTDAARVLRPGGELWVVWNSHLRYREVLERLVGDTRQVARNSRFTLTASTKRPVENR